MRKTIAALAAGLVGTLIAGAAAQAAELTFMSWRQEDKAAYEAMIAEFTKMHPGTTIRFETIEAKNYQTVLSTALAAGAGPDIVHVRAYGNLEAVAAPGYLRAIAPGEIPALDDFPPLSIAAETMRADGKLYAVPFASQTRVIYVNTDILADNGVEAPETWDQMLAAAKKLKDAGVTPFANGTATAWQNEILVGTVVPSFYGAQFEADIVAGKATFEDPRFTGALAKLMEIRDYLPQGYTGVDYETAQQLFLTGRAAMFAGGSWEIANFRRQNPDLNFDVMPSPAPKAGDPRLVSTFFDGGYAINANSAHTDEALEFLRFTASKEFGDMLVGKLGNISPVPGVAFTDPILSKVAEYNKTSASYIMLVHFRYKEPSGSVLLQQWVQKMMAGKATPEEVGAEVTKGIATYHAPFQ